MIREQNWPPDEEGGLNPREELRKRKIRRKNLEAKMDALEAATQRVEKRMFRTMGAYMQMKRKWLSWNRRLGKIIQEIEELKRVTRPGA